MRRAIHVVIMGALPSPVSSILFARPRRRSHEHLSHNTTYKLHFLHFGSRRRRSARMSSRRVDSFDTVMHRRRLLPRARRTYAMGQELCFEPLPPDGGGQNMVSALIVMSTSGGQGEGDVDDEVFLAAITIEQDLE